MEPRGYTGALSTLQFDNSERRALNADQVISRRVTELRTRSRYGCLPDLSESLHPTRRVTLIVALLLVVVATATSCAGSTPAQPVAAPASVAPVAVVPVAVVEGVAVSGEPGAYTLNVTLRSPDTGCDQYADWWEVISAEGELVYRRVLLHSHVGEQPFTRSGGPVEAESATELIVREHMNTGGYGPGMRGTPASGFAPAEIPTDFARSVELAPPLPESCAG